MPIEFIIFIAILLGIAVFHRLSLPIAIGGLIMLLVKKFATGWGMSGLTHHIQHEWVTVVNLLCLLVGFAVVARHFELTEIPSALPKWLPDSWLGGLVLLVMVFVLSGFLDNIAAALIGAAAAKQLYRGKVHIGFLAAIVAASNAGGAGSVIGDTTTTMLWLSGARQSDIVWAYIPGLISCAICGYFGAKTQHNYQPITKHADAHVTIDWARLGIVLAVLGAAVATNIWANGKGSAFSGSAPWIGIAVWVALLASAGLRRPCLSTIKDAAKSSLFLISLVLAASLLPVEKLPPPSWTSTMGLGFLSAIFDNIPLTNLAIHQGGYDQAMLAFSVGFGGSMLWFGSSSGVALTGLFPEGRTAAGWLRHGWFIPVAYVVGFLALLAVRGWVPRAY